MRLGRFPWALLRRHIERDQVARLECGIPILRRALYEAVIIGYARVSKGKIVELRFRLPLDKMQRETIQDEVSLRVASVRRSEIVSGCGQRIRFAAPAEAWVLTNICLLRSYRCGEEACELILEGWPNWKMRLVFSKNSLPRVVVGGRLQALSDALGLAGPDLRS